MTSPTGIRTGADSCGSAFTLIELVLVMALLAAMMALSAPSLSRFVSRRRVENEALRLVAVTEFARSEAVDTGVPFVVWIDPDTSSFGVEPAEGYDTAADAFEAGNPAVRSYKLRQGVRISVSDEGGRTSSEEPAVRFEPDGYASIDSVAAVTFHGHKEEDCVVARTEDGWRYASLSPEEYEEQLGQRSTKGYGNTFPGDRMR